MKKLDDNDDGAAGSATAFSNCLPQHANSTVGVTSASRDNVKHLFASTLSRATHSQTLFTFTCRTDRTHATRKSTETQATGFSLFVAQFLREFARASHTISSYSVGCGVTVCASQSEHSIGILCKWRIKLSHCLQRPVLNFGKTENRIKIQAHAIHSHTNQTVAIDGVRTFSLESEFVVWRVHTCSKYRSTFSRIHARHSVNGIFQMVNIQNNKLIGTSQYTIKLLKSINDNDKRRRDCVPVIFHFSPSLSLLSLLLFHRQLVSRSQCNDMVVVVSIFIAQLSDKLRSIKSNGSKRNPLTSNADHFYSFNGKRRAETEKKN